MEHDVQRERAPGRSLAASIPHSGSPGKRTLTESLGPVVQRARASAEGAAASPSGAPGGQARPTIDALFGGRGAGAEPMRQPIATGGGAGLPEGLRARMEGSFGTDFGGVQIHAESSQAAALGAEAFAYGDALHFAPGRFQPETQAGQALVGHELAHVVQQRAGRVAASAQARGVAINQDPALEREADEQGARAARGEPAAATMGGSSAVAPVVQGVWLSDPKQGVYELPGDVPPPRLGDHFYWYEGVFYPAQQYPELMGRVWMWTRPVVPDGGQHQPLPPQPTSTTHQQQETYTSFPTEPEPGGMELEPKKPSQNQPQTFDPDVLEAEVLVNKTSGMSSLAKKPLLRFLQAAKDEGGLQVILDIREGHLRKEILGFEAWFRRVLKSDGVGNLLFELREALRLVKQDARPVQIDNDSVEGGSGKASVDLFVRRNSDNRITRSVEVMGYPSALDSYGAFFEGVRQGADHLISKLQREAYARGVLEATVAMAFVKGQDYVAWAKQACGDLAGLTGNALIDRVNLVSRTDGSLWYRLARDEKVWSVR